MAARDIIIESIKVTDIFVTANRRPVSDEAVQSLAASIKGIGIQHPITVRFVDHYVDPVEGELEGAYVLVAGRHRLEAARSLSMDCIDCVVVRWDEIQSRKWEIAENLHRSDLTELQRKEQIAEWIALSSDGLQSAQVEPIESLRGDGRGHRREGGINAASRELGVDRTEAQRAVKVASISDRAKQAAVDAHLDNNQSALLRIASSKPERQEDTVREIAAEREARRVSRTNVTVPLAPAPLDEADTREKWLAQGMAWWNRAPQDWRNEFLQRTDLPVFDRTASGSEASAA